MPIYEYHCTNCDCREQRIAGVDDHTVICDRCGQLMLRQEDLDTILASYLSSAETAGTTVGS